MPSTIKIFLSDFIKDHPDIKDIAADFKDYKSDGDLPSHFGRDKPNERPLLCLQEEVWHMHLAHLPIHFKSWPRIRDQHSRKSDAALLYCRGHYDSNCYLLIALLPPPAHTTQEDMAFMDKIGIIAEKFRQNI